MSPTLKASLDALDALLVTLSNLPMEANIAGLVGIMQGLALDVRMATNCPTGDEVPCLTSEEAAMVIADSYLLAIKAVRQRTWCSLKDAKDLVDAWRTAHGTWTTVDVWGNKSGWKWDGKIPLLP